MARSHVCDAAIEFGIKYSSYVYCTEARLKSNTFEIISQIWTPSSGVLTNKSSSCILFRPDQTFHSFGYEAEDKYEELTADNEHNKWYFFKHPTKMLYDCKDMDRTATLFDETNKPLLAIKVYTSAIKYLKDEVMKGFKNRYCGIAFTEEDIKWVFPVPDIWGGAAKQLFREATIQSGIPDEGSSLCLETEAVSTLFRHLTDENLSVPNKVASKKSILQPGSKYLILNAGEEFSYVTVLEVLYSGALRELHKTSGCPWGNSTVNQALIEFIKSLVGVEGLREFKENDRDEYMYMITRLYTKIRSFKMDKTFSLPIPCGIRELYEERQHNTLDTVVKGSRLSEKVSIRRGTLRINPEIVKSFYSNTSDSIIKHVNRVLQETSVKDISTILMVGDLSKSPIFQEAVKQAFPDKRVFASYNPDLDVLKGSALFGHDNNSIITTNMTKNTCRGPRKF